MAEVLYSTLLDYAVECGADYSPVYSPFGGGPESRGGKVGLGIQNPKF